MRAAPLLIALLACDRGPALRNDPDVVWFRSARKVPEEAAARIVADLRGRTDWWAGPVYVFTWPREGDRFVVGHQKVRLREYEATVGTFRQVEPDDADAMACAEVGRLLEKLSSFEARIGVGWQAQLGAARGRIPGSADAVRREACRREAPADVTVILRRYADRPR